MSKTGVSGNFASRYATRFATSYLPRRVKRLIYVSSMIGAVVHEHYPEHDVMRRINAALKLTSLAALIGFPLYFGELIWKNVLGETVVLDDMEITIRELSPKKFSKEDLARISLAFEQKAPGWLKYTDRRELMLADGMEALQFVMA